MTAPFMAVAAGLIPVESSNLAAVGYGMGTLIITSHSGGVYAYGGVPCLGVLRPDACGLPRRVLSRPHQRPV